MDTPSHGRVAAVVAMTDPVARNFAITACYHDLALAVAALVGREDVNWLAFGAWASGTAGRIIRRERSLVGRGTSKAVADGNRFIIADVAPRFIRWLDEVDRAGAPTRTALEVALGDPLFDTAPALADGLAAYQSALELRAVGGGAPLEPALDQAVAETVLLANVRVAAHEQQVADALIDRAMPLGGVFGLITTRFVEVLTPDGPLDVCQDVPAPSYLQGRLYPLVLDHLTDPDLCDLATSFAHARNPDAAGSGASSWESYQERMGFIFAFFRAYARDDRYFVVPPAFLPSTPSSPLAAP